MSILNVFKVGKKHPLCGKITELSYLHFIGNYIKTYIVAIHQDHKSDFTTSELILTGACYVYGHL